MFITHSFHFIKPFGSHTFSIWKKIPKAPLDPILGINEIYKKDLNVNKINLGLGSYRDNDGRFYLLDCVRKAQVILHEQNISHDYLPVEGLDTFNKAAINISYGEDSIAAKEDRIAQIQCVSGTSAIRIGLDLCKKFLDKKPNIYIPKPGYSNHKNICIEVNLPYKEYRYYDPKIKSINFNGLIADLDDAENESIIMLHACSHNPTGCDLNQEQWKQLKDLVLKKKHVVFFDMAFQGFASGDVVKDAWALRLFADDPNIRIILAQSFSKIFGIYGQRLGSLSTICNDAKEANNVVSQLKVIARRTYGVPVSYSAYIVSTILNNPELFQLWLREIKIMSDRLKNSRSILVKALAEVGSKLNWDHINNQIGMFSMTGLEEKEIIDLAEKFQIYLTHDGRISMNGVNTKNVKYIAECFHEVTKEYNHL